MSPVAPTPTTQPLLVELLTEELPPKALQKLGQAFAESMRAALHKQNLLGQDCVALDFATPRRLAVRLSAVLDRAPEQAYTEKLMPAKVGLTADGQATPALSKKLASKGLEHLSPADLTQESDGKQDYLYAKGVAAGIVLANGLQTALDQAIASLPIPKVMQYQLADGVTSVKFVRPAHRLVALWGSQVVAVQALGLSADRVTMGHRFMADQAITIEHADNYQQQLLSEGKVMVSFTERRHAIEQQLQTHAAALSATLGNDPEVTALLDEVTALVEHPTVYPGQFDPQFLSVPSECLILTMRLNQKYFPLFEPASGQLMHRFLIVSNMQVADSTNIVQGNERVVRPRLADAQFFFETDRKITLADRVPSLANSVYHNKLGSQLERIGRVRQVAQYLATQLGADSQLVDRAALLAKADLNSNMVSEFPELQGVMGAYYAQADGEPDEVVLALRNQYRIRIDAPVTPQTITATVLFIAERIETLTGIWGIGLLPTGERDPYALRRAALGVISAVEQLSAGGYLKTQDPAGLAIAALLDFAATTFGPLIDPKTAEQVMGFIYERYRNLLSNDHDRSVVDAVLALHPPLHEVLARVQACTAFAQRPEAQSLAAANKRISNLLKKAEGEIGQVNPDQLVEPAEQALAKVITTLKPQALAQFAQGDFTASLATMAQARDAVDAFFTDIMIMSPDLAVRANRLALLDDLHHVMNQVADISRLAQ